MSSRTQKSFRNTAFGMGSQIIITLLSFITRTAMVRTIGDEAISLNGLFTEVIAALSLAELGIGSAIVYNLYKPLSDKDYKKVCQLMTLFKDIYRIIALVTFLIGLALCPFIQFLINDINYPLSYIRIIYMLFVVQISVSYLFTYKCSLLNADQNRHIYSLIVTIVKIIGTVAMIIALLLTSNFIVYLLFNIGVTIITNVLVSIYVDRTYTYLKTDKGLPVQERKQLFSNVKNIFIKQLSGKITNSTDNILISVLVSTLSVGTYSYYALVINTFKKVVDQIESGIQASLGNLFASDNSEHCNRVLFRLTWILGSFSVFSGICIYCCIIPFVSFWVGPKYMLSKGVLAVLCINMFAHMTSKPIYLAMHVSGFFKEGRDISIIGSTVNLITSIILGMKLGMLGIFIGTSMTFLIQIVLKIRDVYRLRFRTSSAAYIRLWIILFAELCTGMFIGRSICSLIQIDNFFISFIVYGMIGTALSIVIISVTSFKREEWDYSISMLKKVLKRKKTIK